VVNGKKTRYAARCHYCKKVLTALSTGGTGHLLRHHKSCAHKADHAANSQSVLNYNSDGSVRNWDYNPNVARIKLCRLIVRLDCLLVLVLMMLLLNTSDVLITLDTIIFIGKQPLQILLSILIKLVL
jgi:hypothetical protein